MARIRGRCTATRRPPSVTEPSPAPCRVADRSGSCLPRGPQTASTSAFIIAAITCSPVPTAIASRPSCTSPASSAIATLTASGSTGAVALTAVFWYSFIAVPCLLGRLGGRPTPTARQVSGGGPPPQLPRCDMRSHVASELPDRRVGDAVGVVPGPCSRPVPTPTGVAGNGGVRSSGESPRAPVPSGSHRRGEDRTGEGREPPLIPRD